MKSWTWLTWVTNSLTFQVQSFSWGRYTKLLEMNGSDIITIMLKFLMLLNVHLKMIKMVNCIKCIFYHDKKNQQKETTYHFSLRYRRKGLQWNSIDTVDSNTQGIGIEGLFFNRVQQIPQAWILILVETQVIHPLRLEIRQQYPLFPLL